MRAKLGFLLLAALLAVQTSPAQTTARDRLPPPLAPWEAWAAWGTEAQRESPAPFNKPDQPLTFWPSALTLSATAGGVDFRQSVTVYSPSWVPLPGAEKFWPSSVTAGGKPVPVLRLDGRPCVRLAPGSQEIAGRIEWKAMPQNIVLPRETGIVSLTVDGQPVADPLWDANGRLWLKRDASPEEAAGPDSLAPSLYAVLEDGIPLRLRVRLELVVSGKSREEQLGVILPEGWKISSVQSPIPVAVDESGRAKAQVRAGRWNVDVSAFRLDDVRELRFASDPPPPVESVLLGFQARPDFRVLELTGVSPVDAAMTTFPEDWRNVPIYQWPVADAVALEERLRGMDEKASGGLNITRSLWLDENGRGFTFRDRIAASMQRIWRLDAAPGQELGSVRIDGTGQLLTRDPATGAPGVEIRSRNLNLEATGRMAAAAALPATGWQTGADQLTVTLNLPPGWRLFALFGADWVGGDWLTSWSLLDIFVVLVFTLAVFRLWGLPAAALALAAMILSYREPGAPQLLWLALLAPLAILRFTPPGRLRAVVQVWKWLTVAVLVFTVVPFLWAQVQQAIYPQLESTPYFAGVAGVSDARGDFAGEPMVVEEEAVAMPAPAVPQSAAAPRDSYLGLSKSAAQQNRQKQNLLYEAKARIQTGPGVPEWNWRAVRFGWNGPVTAEQQFRPWLISSGVERVLSILRIAAIVALAGLLLGVRRPRGSSVAALLAACLVFTAATPARAQFPDAEMLETLRARLLEKTDLPAQAAEIPLVTLSLQDRALVVEAEVHAATLTAVPLPGRFPAWAPVSVLVDGKPSAALRRQDNYLWVALTPGIHTVRVQGQIGAASEWEWTFLLKPHRVRVDAPGWNVTGINPDGVPEQQVFFARQEKGGGQEAAYDRQEFQTAALVERELELGLIWQVRTTVHRLTPAGKALSLRVPLLPGEKVLSANLPISDGTVEVRLPAGAESISWESELDQSDKLPLATRAGDTWAEQWTLMASPVWNVNFTGLAPVFEPGRTDLVPVWRPWPGESVELTIGRPEPVPGATVTVRRVNHAVQLGARQRDTTLSVALTSSLGDDFLVRLPEGAQVTSLTLNGQDLPARVDQGRLVVPLRPGEQDLVVAWKTSAELGTKAVIDPVGLPVESANITTSAGVPDARWVLWTGGPQRGPAVRFWVILAFSLLAAVVLGRLRASPLRATGWMLLALGLTQVTLPEALVVVLWLFLLAWRGRPEFARLSAWPHNLVQVLLVLMTVAALGILVRAVGAGLLGSPEMFIAGNGSTQGQLQWFLDRSGPELPQPWFLSVSVWWYRLAMLVWALWLATAVLGWLTRGWSAFVSGGVLKPLRAPAVPPPPPPSAS